MNLRAGLIGAVIAAMCSVTAPETARAQAPDWSVDASAFASTMSITAAAFSAGARLGSEADLLAAFVDGEIRGVVGGTIVGDDVVFFLTAYANSEGETLLFRLYNAAADRIDDIAEAIPFGTDGVVGDVANPTVLTVAVGAATNRPDWSVDPAAFGSTMSVIAELFVGGNPSGHANALIGAFVGSELRGVASPIFVGGRWLFFVTVYADGSGESVSFRAYDPDTDTVVLVDEETLFSVDGVVGSASQPLVLNVSGSSGTNRPSWTVDPSAFGSTMSVVAAFFVDGVRRDGSDDLVAAFVDGELRGVASPTSVSGQRLFFITVHGDAADGVLSFKAYDSTNDRVADLVEGASFVTDAVLGSISLPFVLSTMPAVGAGANAPDWSVNAAGFGSSMNIVGALVVNGGPNAHAESRVAAFVGEQIRGVAAPLNVGGRSLFFLTVYANGLGEQITFRAYDAVGDRLRGATPRLAFRPDAVEGTATNPYEWSTEAGGNAPVWTPDSTAFTLSMSLVASLAINGEVSTHPDNRLAAFVGSELRGAASPKRVDGHLVFSMTLLANANGETLRFEAYDAAADTIRTVLETLVFAADGASGTPANPFALSTGVDAPQAAPSLLSPADGAVDVQIEPRLVWGEVQRATSYELELAQSSDFSVAATFGGIVATSLSIADPLSFSTTYFWRVRGVSASQPGPWSAGRRFTTRASGVGIDDDEGVNAPLPYALEQNYPNPFGTGTTIDYSLARSEHVELVVLDLLGRTVATLVDAVQPAGRHAERFSADGLGSGLYLVKIEAGAFVGVRTMTVVR